MVYFYLGLKGESVVGPNTIVELCHGTSGFSYSVYFWVKGQVVADCRPKEKWSATCSGLLSMVISGGVVTFWLMTSVFLMLTANPNFHRQRKTGRLALAYPPLYGI